MILLDVGGGNNPRIEDGYNTISTDIHDFSEDPIFKQPNVSFVKHDALTALPFDDNTVDKVFSQHCLEHLPQRTMWGEDAMIYAIKEMARVCKPGGQIHIIVPYMKHPNATRHPAHYRFFDHEVFNWFTYDYPSPDLEAYEFPRVLRIDRNQVIEETHVYAIFTKLEKVVPYDKK